ncbi:type III secretion system chaperone [Gymnodinialimonas ulvae]|uniref:type III secretion system chaperone n=1 Tax=Gymnodinialimonas ulvae TaxID=3126504 RepID=UPI0030AF5ECF
MLRAIAFAVVIASTPAGLLAQEAEPPMTPQRMAEVFSVLDPDAVIEPNGMSFTIANVPVTVIMDPVADRMRILVPISSADGLDDGALLRLMQANFDTALDARYAIANNRLWATFIHPLSPLETDQLISGVAQTVTLAQTFGDTYSSGAVMFGGGDTRGLIQELLELGEEL